MIETLKAGLKDIRRFLKRPDHLFTIDETLTILERLEGLEEKLPEIIDNITEGRLKHLTVYEASILGSSYKPMINYLTQKILAEVKGE